MNRTSRTFEVLVLALLALTWFQSIPTGSSGPSVEPATEPMPVQTNMTLAIISYMNHWCASPNDRDADLSLSPFTPLLSPDCSNDPQFADWHIKWALEHGVTVFFATSFYGGGWNYFNQGFLRSRYIDKIKFGVALDFSPENWSGPDQMAAALKSGLAFYSHRYFSHPSYYVINSRPALKVTFVDAALRKWGPATVSGMLALVRSVPQGYGFNPFVIGGDAYALPDSFLSKFDAIYDNDFNGNLETFQRASDGCSTAPYGQIVSTEIESANELSAVGGRLGRPFVPTVMPGFDNSKLYHERFDNWCIRITDPSANLFKSWLAGVEPYADKRLRIIFVLSWNEWNEGHSIEPTKEYGFSYVDTVRDLFTTSPRNTWPLDLAPTGKGYYLEYNSNGTTSKDLEINSAYLALGSDSNLTSSIQKNYTSPLFKSPEANALFRMAASMYHDAISAFYANDFQNATRLVGTAIQAMKDAYKEEAQYFALSTSTASANFTVLPNTVTETSIPTMIAVVSILAVVFLAVLILHERAKSP